jgi:hypothetical protein
MTMTRTRAAASHLLISATLSAVVICLLLFGWYPLPYFWALGGLMLLVLIVGIDVVLGPLMTLILFNPKKSGRALTLDLSLIAIVQVSALCYGLYSGYVSRLVFEVFDGKQFQLVQAADVLPDFLKKAPLREYQSLPLVGQRYAATNVPDDDKTKNDLSFYGAFGVGPQFMPQYYMPLEQHRELLAIASISQAALQKRNAPLVAEINGLLQSHQLGWQDIAVVPFDVKTQTYTAVVRLNPVEVLKVLPENPG